MNVLKALGLSVFKYISFVILVVIIAMTTLFSYFSMQMYLFGKGDYLLFVSNNFNVIPACMIMFLIIYWIIIIKEKYINNKKIQKFENIVSDEDELVDINLQSKTDKLVFYCLNKILEFLDIIEKYFIIVKISYILILLVAIYVGMTSYTILYNNSIKISSPLQPIGIIYDYKDIKKINVGLAIGNEDSYYPYYDVILNDGTSINFFGGSVMDEGNKGFEDILFDFDKKIKNQGIVKTVNKENFEKYSEGLDAEFVSDVEKLFIE